MAMPAAIMISKGAGRVDPVHLLSLIDPIRDDIQTEFHLQLTRDRVVQGSPALRPPVAAFGVALPPAADPGCRDQMRSASIGFLPGRRLSHAVRRAPVIQPSQTWPFGSRFVLFSNCDMPAPPGHSPAVYDEDGSRGRVEAVLTDPLCF